MPNIQKEVPLTRIALLRVGAKTFFFLNFYFWLFEKCTRYTGLKSLFGWEMGFASTNNPGKSPQEGSFRSV